MASSDSDSIISYGIIVQVLENLAFELMWREIDLSTDATFVLNGQVRDTGDFPLSHSTSSFGAILTF